jgi:hypothetical protein
MKLIKVLDILIIINIRSPPWIDAIINFLILHIYYITLTVSLLHRNPINFLMLY